MQKKKLSKSAFAYYESLGDARTYKAVARRFSVSLRTVARFAVAHEWQRRLTEATPTESLAAMNQRHLGYARLMQEKALEALARLTFKTPCEAVHAVLMGARLERLLIDMPSSDAAQ